MKKNDKLIVTFGVVILILASVGIYYWVPEEIGVKAIGAEEFLSVTGNLKNRPESITVSDSDPFYPLIATPLAVNYDEEGKQTILPLYVMNIENPSDAVIKIQNEIGGGDSNEIIKDESAKNASLRIATTYWKNSDAALIIEYNQSGYNLGVIATPLASYLRIPIIVTDEMDSDVTNTLSELNVKKTIVLGDNLDGYGEILKFESTDDIINTSITIVEDKFGEDINYITLANPVDAWSPQVLNSTSFSFGPKVIPSGSSTFLLQAIRKGSTGYKLGSFKIPNDYKYALVKFEGINLDYENVDEFGDYVSFNIGAVLDDIPKGLQNNEAFTGDTGSGGIGVRDSNGNLIKDSVYGEAVLYARGGVEYSIFARGQWILKKQGSVAANVVVEKLENPVYAMMKNLSSVAPYLTAYHKGIIFGKPEFAFTADDNILTEQGEISPGFYMPRKNSRIVYKSNNHIFDVIHKQLNDLLAKLANIKLNDDNDLRGLRDYYDRSPVYIAIVGDPTVIPNYIYNNYVEPVDYMKGTYWWGVGTPSDVMYGNIDPTPYAWDNLANDVFTEYPYQENIVGRITGWDSQDASALILRSIFYNEIVGKLQEWKDSFAVLVGSGQDFREPIVRYRLAKIFGATAAGEPMKMWTGYSEMTTLGTVNDIVKPLGFDTIYVAQNELAQRQGFSADSLRKIKFKTTILNKLFFRVPLMEKIVGNDYVIGGDIMEKSSYIFINGHGNMAILGMAGIDLTASGFGGRVVQYILKKVLEVVSPYTGPATSLASHGEYTTREVPLMDLGPSFMWLESCICGKIDGMYPKNSLGQAFLHAGLAALIASPTGSNIGGGYLEPKNHKWDTPISVLRAYFKTRLNALKGVYPDPHFGFLIYSDLISGIKKDGDTIGKAFRDAKNMYLPKDASWKLWWSPPLVDTRNMDITEYNQYMEQIKSQALADPYMMNNKYTSYQEYLLFGDPALKLYMPV